MELLIYLAGIVGGVKAASFFTAVVCFLALLFIVPSVKEAMDDLSSAYKERRSRAKLEVNRLSNFLKIPVTLLVISSLGLLIPSERTIYILAGYKMGKEVVKTEMAQKIYKIVEVKLNEMIETKGE